MGRTSVFAEGKNLAIGRIHSGRLEFNGGAPRGAQAPLGPAGPGSRRGFWESFVNKAGQKAPVPPRMGAQSAGNGGETAGLAAAFFHKSGLIGENSHTGEKKNAPVPAVGTRAKLRFVVPPKFKGRLPAGGATLLPSSSWYGERAVDVSIPAPPLSFHSPVPGRFQPGRPSLCGGGAILLRYLRGSSIVCILPAKVKVWKGGFPCLRGRRGQGRHGLRWPKAWYGD